MPNGMVGAAHNKNSSSEKGPRSLAAERRTQIMPTANGRERTWLNSTHLAEFEAAFVRSRRR
jgi:hypothetical protein